jgi:hypothetical protein
VNPPGIAPIAHTTVMTTICSADRPNAFDGVDQAPRPMMCSAYRPAEASVSSSPVPRLKSRSDRTPRPIVARTTAIQAQRPILCRRMTAASSGVNTTYMPVTKPETLADVCRRPSVWTSCAMP